MKRLLGLLTFLAVVSTTAGSGAGATASAQNGPRGTIGLAPAPLAGQADRGGYFTWQAAKGAHLDDAVVVTNSSGNAVTVLVRAVDGFTAAASGAVYDDEADAGRDDAAWVTPSVDHLTLAPGTSTNVPFTVTVPADARPGDHLAGLAFEDVARSSTTQGSLKVTTASRSVIGALVKVDGPAAARVEVTDAAIVPAEGTNLASVLIGITNVGELLVRPRLTVRIQGKGVDRTIVRNLDTLLPRDHIAHPVPWPDALRAGDYTITATLDIDGLQQPPFTGRASVAKRLPAATSAPQPFSPSSSTRTDRFFTAFVAAASLALGGMLFALLARRRRHGSPTTGAPTDGPAGEG
jgi:hypothetical protein